MPEDIWKAHQEIRKRSNVLYETPWFQILDFESYGYLSYPDRHIVVLPIIHGIGVVMVKVRRPVIGGTTWELPAGACEDGEIPSAAARRELREETGITLPSSHELIPISRVLVSPTRLPVSPEIFKVDIPYSLYERRVQHDSEIEETRLILFDDVKEMMLDGRIVVSMPLAILGRYFLSK
ncbi:MAG: NUDIX hydrolase [Opitutae bacterium]